MNRAPAKQKKSAVRPATLPKRFAAVLERGDRALGWTIARLPFDPSSAWERMIRLRVRGEIRGPLGAHSFRTSLFPDAGRSGSFYLLVNRAMQQASGARLGETAEFLLEPDLEPREAELPDELDALLEDDPALRGWYSELSEYTRREIGKWIAGVKTDDARMRRAEQMAERMMLTMEAERELPPAISRAMQLRHRTRAGWLAMTAAQRRAELFAVFYYQTPDARERRIAKLCDAAERRTS